MLSRLSFSEAYLRPSWAFHRMHGRGSSAVDLDRGGPFSLYRFAAFCVRFQVRLEA
jgi:hypothetical protein